MPQATTDSLRLRADAAYQTWLRERPTVMAVDTETSGLGFHDTPFCVTFAWGNEGHYVELAEWSVAYVKEMLRSTQALVFHNAKFDLQKLAIFSLVPPLSYVNIHDTEAQAHLLDEHQRLGLKTLATDHLGIETDEAQALAKARRELKLTKADGYDRLPREVIIPYAITDATMTLRLHNRFFPQVSAHADLLSLYDMERKLTLALLRMEKRGMRVDVDYLKTTAREYAKRSLDLEVAVRQTTGKDDFNPNSPKQILEAFAGVGIDLDATDADTLAGVDHPLAAQIVELRGVRKMHGTYLQGLLDEQTEGIVHPNFRQHGTRTGRMSSGGATE